MKTIKGPAIFLAQFAGDAAPFNCSTRSAAGPPAWLQGRADPELGRAPLRPEERGDEQDLLRRGQGHARAARPADHRAVDHLQGQLVAVHPAYDAGFDSFAAPEVRGDPVRRQQWAVEQMMLAAKAGQPRADGACELLRRASPGLSVLVAAAPGLIETAFDELAKRWKPILDAFDDAGVDVCYEIHPGEDLHDGVTYEMFLERVGNHPRACLLYDPSHFVLQQLNNLDYIDHYHERIKIFHVKDAEFNPTGKQGVYGGFQGWLNRAGRFRSLGDGQVDFGAIFSKMAAYDYPGWAVPAVGVLPQAPEDGAREGATFIAEHIIRVADRAFDDFRRRRRRRRGERCSAWARCSRWPALGPPNPLPLGRAPRGELMAIEGSNKTGAAPRRIRLGMVGGGRGAFIGAVHRIAAHRRPLRACRRCALVRRRARRGEARRTAHRARRAYADFAEMARREAASPRRRHRRGVHRHAQPPARPHRDRLSRRRHPRHLRQADDDQPADALALVQSVKSGQIFALTHNYSGYRWCARRARWSPPASWARSASSRPSTPGTGCPPSSGQRPEAGRVAGRPGAGRGRQVARRHRHARRAPGALHHGSRCRRRWRRPDDLRPRPPPPLDDNAHILLRYTMARAACSGRNQVAPGNDELRVRILRHQGRTASRRTSEPAVVHPLGGQPGLISRGGGHWCGRGAPRASRPATRATSKALRSCTRDVAEQITARWEGRAPDPLACWVPTVGTAPSASSSSKRSSRRPCRRALDGRSPVAVDPPPSRRRHGPRHRRRHVRGQGPAARRRPARRRHRACRARDLAPAAAVVRAGSARLVAGDAGCARRVLRAEHRRVRRRARHRPVGPDARRDAARRAEPRALRPAILWNDGRSAAQCAELERRAPRAAASLATSRCPASPRASCCGCASTNRGLCRRTSRAAAQGLRAPAAHRRGQSDMSDSAGTLWLDVAAALVRRDARRDRPRQRAHAAPGGGQRSGRHAAPTSLGQLGLAASVVVAGGAATTRPARPASASPRRARRFSLGTSGVFFVANAAFSPAPGRAVHAFCHCFPAPGTR